jgi:hypothetical protein
MSRSAGRDAHGRSVERPRAGSPGASAETILRQIQEREGLHRGEREGEQERPDAAQTRDVARATGSLATGYGSCFIPSGTPSLFHGGKREGKREDAELTLLL